jgi:hypothetical protein
MLRGEELGIGVTPALTRAKASIASWLPCTAVSSCTICGSGGCSEAICAVISYIGSARSSRLDQ